MKNITLLFLLFSITLKSQIDKKTETLYEQAFYKCSMLPEFKKQYKNNKKSLYKLYTEYVSGSKPIIQKANSYIETRSNGSKRYTTNYYFYMQQKYDEFEKEFCAKNKISWAAINSFRYCYGDNKLNDYEYFKKDN